MRLDSDLFLILGIIVAVMAVPAVISAFSAGKPPRAAAISAVIGGVLILIAVANNPGGYRAQDVPAVAARVIDRYID